MKKWLAILSLLSVLLIWLCADVLISLKQDEEKGWAKAAQIIDTMLEGEIITSSRFHGDQVYYIFKIEHKGEEQYAIVDEEGELQTFPVDAVKFSREELISQLLSAGENWEVRAVRLAFVQEQLCWEAVLVDQDDQMIFAYYRGEDGQLLTKYILEK